MINADFLHSIMTGDEEAIQALIRAHQRQIFQLALSILDTSKTKTGEAAAQAEIATRETFMAAIDRIGHFRDDSNFSTWLYGIAIEISQRRSRRWRTGQALSRFWRKIIRRPVNDPQWDGGLLHAGTVPTPVEAAPAAMSDEALWNAVRSLDDRLRLPVVLRYYHDLPVSEIAALLHISEGAVHARLDQARDKLAGK